MRFGRSAKAEEIFQDVIDGIRSNVSVGYQIDEVVLEKEEKDKASIYRVTRWEPYEISLVSVPADINVGVGRNEEEGKEIEIKIPVEIKLPRRRKERWINVQNVVPRLKDGKCAPCEVAQRHIELQNQPSKTQSAVELEKERKRGIENLCKINKIPDNIRDGWISQGLSMAEVSDQLLLVLEERGKTNPQSKGSIGLIRKGNRKF